MSDIFAGQGADAERLAEIYDLEHDEVTEDLDFWRELAARHPGPMLDLGCGSGRLFEVLLAAGAAPLIGLDGSPELLDRARRRIAASASLRRAAEAGALVLARGDARDVGSALPSRTPPCSLIILAGVVPHLEGAADLLRTLAGAAALLADDGRLVLDDLGPARLPRRDLPLSVDWRRGSGEGAVVRRSQLTRHEAPDGLEIVYSTLTDVERADGTIARLPASFRLWYPSHDVLLRMVTEAGLTVELTWGSYDLEAFDRRDSERSIVVAHRRDDGEDLPAG